MSVLQTSLIPHTLHFLSKTHTHRRNAVVKPFPSITLSHNPDPPKPKPKPKSPIRHRKPEPKPKPEPNPKPSAEFQKSIPRKPRRGRRSEAAAVEDYVRARLEETFAAMQEQNPELFKDKDKIFKAKRVEKDEDEDEDEAEDKEMVMEEESEEWPLDADVGWGISASEYFEKHPIKNVVGEDGLEIDWEGETEDSWVKEINCLEWESFAFHPSPLVVFVFERYNRASDNWKALKELEKAVKVYWEAKDRLPPRSVKIDINIERDLAYALKVKEGPQILFLRGNRILYKEKEFRTADELVRMIAYFYYNAKKPSWIDASALSRPYH